MNQLPELVPIEQIVPNPWRDLDLFPLASDHVADLKESIGVHGFFASVKGRRRLNKVQLGCGHSRWQAARDAGLKVIPIYLDDKMDEDLMIRLMIDENALQPGSYPDAVMNEVAACMRRLIDGLLGSKTVPEPVALAYDDIDKARAKLRDRPYKGGDAPIDYHVILRYIGRGDEKAAPRGDRQIRDAIAALKQSGRFDRIVDDALLKYPSAWAKLSKSKTVAKKITPTKPPRKRIFDERTAHLFPVEREFHAFREAVTTEAAQRVIPVENQYELAQEIANPEHRKDWRNKHMGAPAIKAMVSGRVEQGLKAQRSIDNEERARLFQEQASAEIDATLHSANASLRSLVSSITRLAALATKYPGLADMKIGGFAAKLAHLVGDIERFSKHFDDKPKKAARSGLDAEAGRD